VRCSVKHSPDEKADCASFAYDFQMEFMGGWTPSEGLAALLDFLDIVLRLEEFRSGFVLSFDFRGLYQPKLDVMVAIREWSESPRRKSLWSERCRFWRVAIAEVSFMIMYHALFCLFVHDPPSCDTYVVTDISETFVCNGEYCFRKRDNSGASITEFADNKGIWEFAENPTFGALPLVSFLSSVTDQLWSIFDDPKAVSRRPLSRISNRILSKRTDIASTPGNNVYSPRAAMGTNSAGFPSCSSVETTAAVVTQRFVPETGLGELLIEVGNTSVTQESLQPIMDFMDEFTASPNAANGFCIIYDLREMRIPSMTMVMRVAEWGGEPARKETWERKNQVCKIVLNPGLKFSILVGILTSFFYACPPVCRTFVMHSLEDADAVIFEPPVKSDTREEDPDISEDAKMLVHGRLDGPDMRPSKVDEPLVENDELHFEPLASTRCPQRISISGATGPAMNSINGTYELTGSYNGRPSWQKHDKQMWLVWAENNRWCVTTFKSKANNDGNGVAAGPNTLLPTGVETWEVYNTEDDAWETQSILASEAKEDVSLEKLGAFHTTAGVVKDEIENRDDKRNMSLQYFSMFSGSVK